MKPGDKDKAINVMTSCSDSNCAVVQVLIYSLSQSHRDYQINFWFFHVTVGDEKIAALDAYCRSLPNVSFFEVRVTDVSDFEEMKKIGGKPDCERFLWFSAHRYLPKDLDRVLYLDALDTIVVDSLEDFYCADFNNKYLLVCREINQFSGRPQLQVGPARDHFEQTNDKDVVARISHGIFNSGSIVLNLEKFRKEAPSLKHYCETAKWAKDLLGATFGDQGLFSLVHGSDFELVDDKYNYRFFVAYKPTNIIENPSVIHFCGFSPKPFRIYFTREQSEEVIDYISEAGGKPFMIGSYDRIDIHYPSYYKMWWDLCEKTPIYHWLFPQAVNNTMEKVIKPIREGKKAALPRAPASVSGLSPAPSSSSGDAAKPKPKAPDSVVNSQGIRIYIDENDARGKRLVASGGFLNPSTMRAWKLLLAESRWTHLIDVGANYGEMLVHTPLPIGVKVYAFEPNPTILRRLRRTIRESGLPDINVIGAAMSDHIGTQTLYVDPNWSGTTRFSRDGDTPKNYKPVEVNTMTLQAVISRLAESPNNISLLLKIDVEGHEVPVLKGLAPVLDSLEDFECLIEVVHLPDDALEYLIKHFDLRCYNKTRNELTAFSPLNATEFRAALKAPDIYGQDAVLRRKLRR